VGVGADGVAGDPGRKTAVAMTERAGEDIGECLARDDAQAFNILGEATALGDRLNELCAGWIAGTAVCLDRDVAGVQGKDEQSDQESWLRESEQSVEWIFCLTAARVLVANQEQR
jgi:hypothetical protein